MCDRADVRRAERLENTGSGSNRALHSSPVWRSHIGEVARSDGGVNSIEGAEYTDSGVKSRPPFVYHKRGGVCRRTREK